MVSYKDDFIDVYTSAALEQNENNRSVKDKK